MKHISMDDLDNLALGATVLGAGGGGDPAYDLLITKQQLEDGNSISLVDLEDIDDDAVVLPVAFMGAPLVCIEKLPSGREFEALLQVAEEVLGKKITHLVAAEVGGGNAFTPLIVGAMSGIPVIDADTLGRAFPELQMSTCNLKGISPKPAFLGDGLGNTVVVNASEGLTLERLARNVTVEMGSISALGAYVMSGKKAKESVIAGTVTQAISMGRVMHEAGKKGDDPIKALTELTGGKLLGTGMIADVEQSIEGGFLKGTFTISDGSRNLKVHYQNEFLAVFDGKEPLASTPDIIIPIEQETGVPITSESLVYGIRVSLLAIPGPDIWKSPEGLKLVGPEYFGYPINYEEVKL